MEIILDIAVGPDGRLTGTAGLSNDRSRRPFSGTMELLACIEELCQATSAGAHRAYSHPDSAGSASLEP